MTQMMMILGLSTELHPGPIPGRTLVPSDESPRILFSLAERLKGTLTVTLQLTAVVLEHNVKATVTFCGRNGFQSSQTACSQEPPSPAVHTACGGLGCQ
jgi:hypothetical protein